MKYIIWLLVIGIIAVSIVFAACQDDPADEFASEDIYFDNAYHLDGTPWVMGGAGDDMGDVDTELELEATLIDTVNVYTDNDGALPQTLPSKLTINRN